MLPDWILPTLECIRNVPGESSALNLLNSTIPCNDADRSSGTTANTKHFSLPWLWLISILRASDSATHWLQQILSTLDNRWFPVQLPSSPAKIRYRDKSNLEVILRSLRRTNANVTNMNFAASNSNFYSCRLLPSPTYDLHLSFVIRATYSIDTHLSRSDRPVPSITILIWLRTPSDPIMVSDELSASFISRNEEMLPADPFLYSYSPQLSAHTSLLLSIVAELRPKSILLDPPSAMLAVPLLPGLLTPQHTDFGSVDC